MKTHPKIVLDHNVSQAYEDFNLKLTQDMFALLQRSRAIMSLEIGREDAINLILAVLAIAGVTTACGGGRSAGTFAKYAELAEKSMRLHERRAGRSG